jgi:hypothetical protein
VVCHALGKGGISGFNISVLIGVVCFDTDELYHRVTTHILVTGVTQRGNTVGVHTDVWVGMGSKHSGGKISLFFSFATVMGPSSLQCSVYRDFPRRDKG